MGRFKSGGVNGVISSVNFVRRQTLPGGDETLERHALSLAGPLIESAIFDGR